jgi:hypothetical protein
MRIDDSLPKIILLIVMVFLLFILNRISEKAVKLISYVIRRRG